MFSIWIANAQKRELTLLETTVRDTAALLSDSAVDCCAERELLPLLGKLQQLSVPDLACVDLALPESLPFSRTLRRQSRALFLVVVAPPDLSPMQYLRPDILAGGLLLRPFTGAQAGTVLRDALSVCLQTQEASADACFWVVTRSSREAVRYTDILYFEARGKRIFLVTAGREYSFADTIEHLEGSLPNGFVRCHRSFIVRLNHIDRIQLSANLLYLNNGEVLPLSRSYKANLKGFFK